MTSDGLTKSQLREIHRSLFRGTNYLVRLKQRMEKAYHASNRLSSLAHHLSCDGVNGSNRPKRKPGPE